MYVTHVMRWCQIRLSVEYITTFVEHDKDDGELSARLTMATPWTTYDIYCVLEYRPWDIKEFAAHCIIVYIYIYII